MTGRNLPALRQAEDISLAEAQAYAAEVREWRKSVRATRNDEATEEGWRRLLAVESYVKNAKARKAIQAEARLTEFFIGDLLGPAAARGDTGRGHKSSNFEDLHDEYRHLFRFYFKHEKMATKLVEDHNVVGRKPLEKAIRDALAKPPLLADASVTHADWREWLRAQPDCPLLFTDPPYMTDLDDVAAFAEGGLAPALAQVKTTGP